MRLFFNHTPENTTSDSSCILNSVLPEQSVIQSSVVCNVKCSSIQANQCIIMNVVARSIIAKPGSIVYNIITDKDVLVLDNEVHVGVYDESGKFIVLHSNMSTDGGIDIINNNIYVYIFIIYIHIGVYWEKLVLDNVRTFDENYQINDKVDPMLVEIELNKLIDRIWNLIRN